MADPVSAVPDASIDLNRAWQIHYWTEALGITRDQLEKLVRENGPLVAFVRKALERLLTQLLP